LLASLVYLSLISEFSFLLECRLVVCQQELKSILFGFHLLEGGGLGEIRVS